MYDVPGAFGLVDTSMVWEGGAHSISAGTETCAHWTLPDLPYSRFIGLFICILCPNIYYVTNGKHK